MPVSENVISLAVSRWLEKSVHFSAIAKPQAEDVNPEFVEGPIPWNLKAGSEAEQAAAIR